MCLCRTPRRKEERGGEEEIRKEGGRELNGGCSVALCLNERTSLCLVCLSLCLSTQQQQVSTCPEQTLTSSWNRKPDVCRPEGKNFTQATAKGASFSFRFIWVKEAGFLPRKNMWPLFHQDGFPSRKWFCEYLKTFQNLDCALGDLWSGEFIRFGVSIVLQDWCVWVVLLTGRVLRALLVCGPITDKCDATSVCLMQTHIDTCAHKAVWHRKDQTVRWGPANWYSPGENLPSSLLDYHWWKCNAYSVVVFLPTQISKASPTNCSDWNVFCINNREKKTHHHTMTLQIFHPVPQCKVQHNLVHVLLLLLLQSWWGNCHPQCLDYKPPFEPRQPLAFCKEYSKFGCCDLEKDEEISKSFYSIMENFDHSGYVTCGKYIRSILCQVRETFQALWWTCHVAV